MKGCIRMMLAINILWDDTVIIYDDCGNKYEFKIIEIFNRECDDLFLIGVNADNGIMILKDMKVTIYNTKGEKMMEEEVGEISIRIV